MSSEITRLEATLGTLVAVGDALTAVGVAPGPLNDNGIAPEEAEDPMLLRCTELTRQRLISQTLSTRKDLPPGDGAAPVRTYVILLIPALGTG